MNMHLFVMDADGSNLTAVTDGVGELNIMPQWSGEGDALLYQVRPSQTFRSLLSQVVRRVKLRRGPSGVNTRQPSILAGASRLLIGRERGLTAVASARPRDRVRTALPFALYEHRFSRDGRLIAGESRDHEVVVCESASGQCRPLTPKNDRALTALAWSGDGTRLFFLRYTSARVWGGLNSVRLMEAQ